MTDLNELRKRAQKIIDKNGKFLLACDVVDSKRRFLDIGYKEAYRIFRLFCELVSEDFKNFITSGDISIQRRFDSFEIIIGDSGGGFFTSVDIVEPVIKLAEETLPFRLVWAVGEDGWDRDIKDLVC